MVFVNKFADTIFFSYLCGHNYLEASMSKVRRSDIVIIMCQIFLGIPMLILAFAPITFPIIDLAVKYLSNEDGGVDVKEEIVIDNTINVNGFSYSIDNDTARLEKIKDSTIIDIVVPNHIIVNGSCIPVTDVAACGLCEYNTDNILSYSSDVDIPLFFYYDNIERINSRVRSICPNLNDLFRLKTLNLYGEDYILSFDYEDKFLQGCYSLEEVRVSGASIVVIKDGFNYCTNLKTLIFDDVEYLFLSGGFKGTSNLDSIVVIKSDTTGYIYSVDKKIVYMN